MLQINLVPILPIAFVKIHAKLTVKILCLKVKKKLKNSNNEYSIMI